MFTVTGVWSVGTSEPRFGSVTWRDGALSGDRDAVDAVLALANELWGQIVGPVEGPTTSYNHLASPISALEIITSIFDPEWEGSGDIPEREPIPVGAE